MSKSSYQQGLFAERLAATLLWFKGYRILERRFKTPGGEIDILAARGQTLHIVEVKWRAKQEDALWSLSPHQQKRLLNAGKWVLGRRSGFTSVSFDGIFISKWAWPLHLQNIFADEVSLQ